MSECGWLAYYCTSDKPRLEIRPSCFHWLRESVQSHWLHVTSRHPPFQSHYVTSPVTHDCPSRSAASPFDEANDGIQTVSLFEQKSRFARSNTQVSAKP